MDLIVACNCDTYYGPAGSELVLRDLTAQNLLEIVAVYETYAAKGVPLSPAGEGLQYTYRIRHHEPVPLVYEDEWEVDPR